MFCIYRQESYHFFAFGYLCTCCTAPKDVSYQHSFGLWILFFFCDTHFVCLLAASLGIFIRKLGVLCIEGRERGRLDVYTFLWIHSKTKHSKKLWAQGLYFISGIM